MTVKLCDATTIAMCDALVDLIDGGAGAGTLKIYSDAQGADPDAQATTGLLATLTFSDPAFGAAATSGSNAVATASAITDESSSTSGTAASFLVEDSNGANIFTGTVSTSGADLNLNTTTIPSAGTVSITSMTVTVTRDP